MKLFNLILPFFYMSSILKEFWICFREVNSLCHRKYSDNPRSRNTLYYFDHRLLKFCFNLIKFIEKSQEVSTILSYSEMLTVFFYF
jgi:hypothetical protein